MFLLGLKLSLVGRELMFLLSQPPSWTDIILYFLLFPLLCEFLISYYYTSNSRQHFGFAPLHPRMSYQRRNIPDRRLLEICYYSHYLNISPAAF